METGSGLADLVRVLDVAPAATDSAQQAPDHFIGDSVSGVFGGRVYGGQVLAQSLIAAGHTVEQDRYPHSMHAYFLREGIIGPPIEFEVENLRDGRSFSTRRVQALQEGRPILSATASFQLLQPGYDAQHPMPRNVPPPESLVSASEVVRDVPSARWWGRESAFELVSVNPSIILAPDPNPTNRQLVWVRTRSIVPPAPDDISDQLWQRALLAFACDQLLLEPAIRGAGISWADVVQRPIPIASLDHAMWWHRDFRADEWLLFVQEAGSSQNGRTMGQARVYTRSGELVASIAQEGMMRLED